MMKMVLRGMWVAAILCLFSSSAFAEQLRVIGNRSVPVASLEQKAIKDIYLGKVTMWNNGMKVVFVTLTKGDTQDAFLKKYVKKNRSTFNRHWKKKVFTGEGQMPLSFEKERDLVEFVEKTKGAIGFVTSGAATDQVKILSEMSI
ncbi:substrate-binding domain-containing protein [Desulfoluna sp.]|uniref:substrate-binding domain-containing protein n=1 Tax=Desulfoluna sp. TaxID=2045199 RepID=UPI00260D7094|nr:substrate-binding domain-containing protein [Desulfoluna sp.]